MRIALLTHEPFHPPSGGGSAAALYLVRELRRRGHSLHIFGPAIDRPLEVAREFGVTLHGFNRWRMGRTTPWRTPKYLLYPFALSRQVSAAIHNGLQPDLIVAQHSISAVAAGRLRARHRIPTVLNLLDCLTGFMETWPSLLMPRPVARALVGYELSLPRNGHADAVLTVSDPLRDRIIARGYPASQTHAIYYGYDAGLFRTPTSPLPHPNPNPHPSDTGPLIVMHGSFDHHHLGPIAYQAIATIATRRPEVRFRFIGPRTKALSELESAVRQVAPRARLETTGFIPYREIPDRLADADLGMTPYQPSTGTHCAFVAKTVECLALGIPVVSTPLESAVRYYQGLEGIRFSAPDGTGFAEAALAWLDLPPAERRAAVEPARRKVAAELDWSVVCGRAAGVIESIPPAPRPAH